MVRAMEGPPLQYACTNVYADAHYLDVFRTIFDGFEVKPCRH